MFCVVNAVLNVVRLPHLKIIALDVVVCAILVEFGSLVAVIFELVVVSSVLSRLRQYLVNPIIMLCLAVFWVMCIVATAVLALAEANCIPL